MAYPQITYYSRSTLVTLAFTYPPRNVAAYNSVARRHDNISSSGVRESVLERIDNFLEIEMQTVLDGADVADWNAFMQYVLQGGQFSTTPTLRRSHSRITGWKTRRGRQDTRHRGFIRSS
jgi:hypothetical protein